MSKKNAAQRRAARERADAEARRKQAADAALRRRRRAVLLSAVAVLVVIVAVALGWALTRGSAAPTPQSTEKDPVGVVAAVDGQPLIFRKPGAVPKHILTLWVDARCQHCQTLEKELGPTMDRLLTSGELELEVYLASYQGEVSQRAARGMACAAPAGFGYRYYQSLWNNGSLGYTDEQVVQLGRALAQGKDVSAFETCVRSGAGARWAASQNQAGHDHKIEGTPTVLVDGRAVPLDQLRSAKDLEAKLS